MKTPRISIDGVGYVHACRCDERNEGGTRGPMWRMRGRISSRPHLHGVALHNEMNAPSSENLTAYQLEGANGSRTLSALVPRQQPAKAGRIVAQLATDICDTRSGRLSEAAACDWRRCAR
jgi:hypothetical protein